MIAAPQPVDDVDLTVAVLGPPDLAFVVVGTPAPQGSKKAIPIKGLRRSVVVESSKAVKPWRAAVAMTAVEAAGPGWVPLDGPLVADLIFTRRQLASAPRRRRTLPATMPDLSKLVRSTEDGLGVDAGVITDDARIVAFRRQAKFYAGDPDPDALAHPGAVIRLWRHPVQRQEVGA